MKVHPPSPFIITQPKSWYSFYHPTEGRRLSNLSVVLSHYGLIYPQNVDKGSRPFTTLLFLWLPIECRIKFKIARVTYKTVSAVHPAYLNSVLKQYVTSRGLCSSDCSLLAVPHVCICFGSRSFAVAAPTTWNSLPLHICNSSSIFGFRHRLKTFLYK